MGKYKSCFKVKITVNKDNYFLRITLFQNLIGRRGVFARISSSLTNPLTYNICDQELALVGEAREDEKNWRKFQL